ncbi:MAG: N-(5'-phosphoribosyl)anthranilate isomerase [Phycisphaerae bacterium]
MPTRIKICGVMRPEDAALAAELGVDAVGVIRHPGSRRFVDGEALRKIIAACRPFVTVVGVYVDAPPEQIREEKWTLGLGAVQLHGVETPQTVRDLSPLNVIKMIRPGVTSPTPYGRVPIVVDTPHTVDAGGSGIENEWDLVETMLADGRLDRGRTLVAGGLRPQNVGAVVRRLRPYGVDVSSGVESEFGAKDPAKLRAFVKEVRAASA